MSAARFYCVPCDRGVRSILCEYLVALPHAAGCPGLYARADRIRRRYAKPCAVVLRIDRLDDLARFKALLFQRAHFSSRDPCVVMFIDRHGCQITRSYHA